MGFFEVAGEINFPDSFSYENWLQYTPRRGDIEDLAGVFDGVRGARQNQRRRSARCGDSLSHRREFIAPLCPPRARRTAADLPCQSAAAVPYGPGALVQKASYSSPVIRSMISHCGFSGMSMSLRKSMILRLFRKIPPGNGALPGHRFGRYRRYLTIAPIATPKKPQKIVEELDPPGTEQPHP